MVLKKDGDPSSQTMFQNFCTSVLVSLKNKLVKVISNWHAKESQDFIFSTMLLFHS